MGVRPHPYLGTRAESVPVTTSELGAMRVSEEIDALEVMGIEPVAYLVSTRTIAAGFSILPIYLTGLLGSYIGTQITVTLLFGQATGTYAHYFRAFLNPWDVVLSVVKAVLFAIIVTMVHCYYGFYASGGPEGVGKAAGRAIRTSIIVVVFADMALTLAFWGYDPGVRLTG